VGFLSTFGAIAKGTLEPAPAVDFTAPSAYAGTTDTGAASPSVSTVRAQAVAISIAMQIPAVRKAVSVIAGTPSTFALSAWAGENRLPDTDIRSAWLRQPMPGRTLQWSIYKTLADGVWYDRCLWRFERDIAGRATRFRRVHPNQITAIEAPNDPDTVDAWTVDGKLYSDAELRRDFLVFDFAGMGGLKRFGAELLELYADLQTAAGNYARAPHPKAILKNHGADLKPEEIDALLDSWEAARATRSIGYLNDAMDYDVTTGWNPEQLQLVQSREHAALEVARLFGLPAKSVDAKSGDSLTYATLVDWRRAELGAIRPWMNVFTQTLSMDDRSGRPAGVVLPLGIRAEFDVDDYLRDSPLTRMQTWETALRSGALDLSEVRSAEPLARSAR